MSWSAITSMISDTARSEKLPCPHQLTLMTPTPDAAIQRAYCSTTARDLES